METCSVCVESYNKTTRVQVVCAYCSYSACRTCYETYILQSSAKCMNCLKEMTREEIVKKFTKKFVATKYKEYREKCLFDLEKSMLPATQPVVERMIENERLKEEIIRIRIQISKLYNLIQDYELLIRGGEREKTDRKTFIRKCPNADCRGFLSTQWKCNLCERKTCKECNESMPDLDDHKCDPNNVETAKLLAKDSKPCPKCGEMIFKIDGCAQIWCTQCRTAFNWNTGKIETGVVHNPHYFEWLKSMGRDVSDNPERDMHIRCGREIDHFFVRDLTRNVSRRNVSNDLAVNMCRNLIHFRAVELPRYQTDRFNDNQDLRVLYLRNRITEETFRTTLQKREKARQKKEDYYRLFAMMIQCVTEIMFRYYDQVLKARDEPIQLENKFIYKPVERTISFEPYLNEIVNLLTYVNECLHNISVTYSCQKYILHTDLSLESVRN